MGVPTPRWLVEEVRQAKRGENAAAVAQTSALLERLRLPTVCESARCPNRGECFSHHTATFLILGDVCTRGCRFCAVKRGRPEPRDPEEPTRLAEAVKELGLRHAVITSVTRDDLEDGGAKQFAAVVLALRERCPEVKVELLVPDLGGSAESLAAVLEVRPDILAHNVETVPRLYAEVRRGADYGRSLALLQRAKQVAPKAVTKSGLMLGLGEKAYEVEAVLSELAGAGCDMLTLGQYLAPSLRHAPVARYVDRAEFAAWRSFALGLGFRSVAAGPLVRSSYKAPVFFGGLAGPPGDTI